MAESSKKHSRKSKLVERTYEEIDELNEVKLQPYAKNYRPKPPEIKPPHIPPKAPEPKPPIELSVNVEVEEGDEDWYREMVQNEIKEKEAQEKILVSMKACKNKRNYKKKRNVKDLMVKDGEKFKKEPNEQDLIRITKGQGIICVDSTTDTMYQDKSCDYHYILTVETLLLSPYTAFYGPINYQDILMHKNRSHLVHNYYCMPCKQKCGSKHQFLTHLGTHSIANQVYYTVTKFNDQPALICTTQPQKYLSDCVLGDIGMGKLISIVDDYETAIKNVVTKWYRSIKKAEVENGILSYKCYTCALVCEFYSQFISHLKEKHESRKLIISTEVLFDNYMNVVASEEFKPAFKDLTLIPNLSKYKCYRCKKVFDTYDAYWSHCRRINVCAGCGVELPCQQMKLHEGLCNRFLTVFYPKMCPCKAEFSSSREMTEHQIQCKFGRTALVFNCLVCNYLAPSTVRLLIHQRLEHYVRSDIISTTFKVSVCRLCGEKYAGSFAHCHYCKKREDIVDCSFCGMLFQNEYFLNIHIKAYPSAVCGECNEYFTASCAMIEHGMVKHDLYQDLQIKYRCTSCDMLFDRPEKEGDALQEGHMLKLHEKTSKFISHVYNYKKIYMPKVMKGTYGYVTGIYPPQEPPSQKIKPVSEDIEDLIDVALIKKSNIISKSINNQVTFKPKTVPILKTPAAITYDYKIDITKTINEEHNYDKTHSGITCNDGTYDVVKFTNADTSSTAVDSSNYNLQHKEYQLLADRSKKSTVIGRNTDVFVDKLKDVAKDDICHDNNERYFKIEAVDRDDCDTDIVIEASDVKSEIKDARNIILDSFSDINEDMIKCEPDAETILVQTSVPVSFAGFDDAKASCSKDNDFSIKCEIQSEDESDNYSGDDNGGIDKPVATKYPEEIEIGFSSQTSNSFETEDKSMSGDEKKSLKRKLNHSTFTRATKSKPNSEITEETNPALNEALDDKTKSVLETAKKPEHNMETQENENENNLETQENDSNLLKKPSKSRRKKRRLTMRKKPTIREVLKPFRGFEPRELGNAGTSKEIIEAPQKNIETPQKSVETNENQSETDDFNYSDTETTDTRTELGESSSAETVSIKSEIFENKLDNDKKITVKLEIKEEYEEYETDLIIFDEADLSNDNADEKFVEISPKNNIRDSPSAPKIYFCKRCQFTGHHKDYKDHLLSCKKGLPKRTFRPAPKKIISLKYNCIKCNLECDDLRDYLKHLPIHGYEELHCPCCNEGVQTANKLAEHVLRHIKADFKKICFLQLNNKPMELKKFRCCTCKMIVDQEDFFGHWQVHFDRVVVKRLPVTDIRAAVIRAEHGELARSVALETGVKGEICTELQAHDPLKNCILCKKQFTRIHDIKRHLIEHLTMDALCYRPSLKSMKCQICSEDFDYTDLYKRHMRDHGSLPLYQCQICDKSFSDSSNFGKHKKVHDVFEFVCDICRRKFQSKITLVNHMMLHEKHKVITCELCNKKFYFPSAYKKHLRAAHEKGIPKHSCTLCKTKFFSTKEQLNHEWREHGLRKTPMDCPLCDQGYRRIIDLKTHLKQAHSMPYFTVKNRKKIAAELKVRGVGQNQIDEVFSRLCAAKGIDVSE